jgi:ankyrin repeat protein
MAARFGRDDVCELLLSRGADVASKDDVSKIMYARTFVRFTKVR